MSEPVPYLSVVSAFGHAQRDEQWVRQTRVFLATLLAEAAQSALPLEIILVDRDPAGTGESAVDLLAPLPESDHAAIRIITVPGEEAIACHPIDRERRAQNVGIRRARGEFVLATGTDVIPGLALMRHLASRPLREHRLYYALRIETAPFFADMTAGGIESACRHGAFCATLPPWRAGFDGVEASVSDDSWDAMMRRAGDELNIGTMGGMLGFAPSDFVLMSRQSWHEIGGFPEWNVGDFHFDRVVLAQARYRGWSATLFPTDCHYFAIAALRRHDVTRDIYVDADGDQRIRIESPPIRDFNSWQSAALLNNLKHYVPFPPQGPLVEIRVNDSDWGLGGFALPEQASRGSRAMPDPIRRGA